MVFGSKIEGLWFRVWGLGFEVWGSGVRVCRLVGPNCAAARDSVSGDDCCRVQGVRSGVCGLQTHRRGSTCQLFTQLDPTVIRPNRRITGDWVIVCFGPITGARCLDHTRMRPQTTQDCGREALDPEPSTKCPPALRGLGSKLLRCRGGNLEEGDFT